MDAQRLLDHHDRATLWAEGSGLDLAAAYQRALEVRRLRIARGEVPRGFKIGFTNRTIWPRYEVYGPIWGTVWDTTLSFCEGHGDVDLARLCQPRLEPEAAFGMKATPPKGATLQQLFESIDWVAPAFEVVHTHLAGWKFTAGDTVADSGLHGKLLVGPRVPVQGVAGDATAFDARLAGATARLMQGGTRKDQGRGANVLDGPLHALHHFLKELRACPNAPDLVPGDVVTTGTWTDAWPVAAGETWAAEFDDVLGRLETRFV